MNWEVFITCAVTGAGDTAGRSEHVPVTPEQIADAAIDAARAGAAVAHIHVRDPDTGRGARDPALYRAAVERIRASDVDVVLNLTAGMGGDLVLGGEEAPLPPDDDGHGHGRRGGAARPRRGAAAGDLHPRLRDDELRRRRRLRHGQHARDAARDGGADPASSESGRSSRSSTRVTSCSSTS